jgi:hypothetical protein
MDKIRKFFTEPKTSQQGEMRRMGRRRRRRGDRIARSIKLVLLPCLCDLNEPMTGRLRHARERFDV